MMTAACEVGLAVIFGMKSSVQRDMVRIQALGCPWRNAEEALGLSGGRSCGNGCRDDEKSGCGGMTAGDHVRASACTTSGRDSEGLGG